MSFAKPVVLSLTLAATLGACRKSEQEMQKTYADTAAAPAPAMVPTPDRPPDSTAGVAKPAPTGVASGDTLGAQGKAANPKAARPESLKASKKRP